MFDVMFVAGCSFWIDPEPHLNFLLSDPQLDSEELLYVNITSYHVHIGPKDAENDPACIIMPDEHPWVTVPTCLYYYGAHVANLRYLRGKYDAGKMRFNAPAGPELLQRMRVCAGDSIHMEGAMYAILERQELV